MTTQLSGQPLLSQAYHEREYWICRRF